MEEDHDENEENRFYLLDAIFFMIHKLSFMVSPLNKRLMMENVRQDLRATSAGGKSVDWLWALSHPLEVMRLVERYQLVERKYIYLLLLHLLLYAHFMVKFFIYSGGNTKLNDNINWSTKTNHYRIYGDIVGSFPNPVMLNRLWFGFCLITLTNRLHQVIRTIRSSIVNRDYYKEISVNQLNLAGFLVLNRLHLRDLKYLNDVYKCFGSRLKEDALFRKMHYEKSLRSSVAMRENFHKLSQSAKLYYMNAIDFRECYKKLAGNFEKPQKRYKSWFVPRPIHRIGSGAACFIVSGFLFLYVLYTLGVFGYVFFYTFSLAFNLAQREENLSAGNLLNQFTKPLVQLNALEMCVFVMTTLPWYLNCALFIADVVCIVSRVNRIIEMIEIELIEAGERLVSHQQTNNFRVSPRSRRRLNENFSFYIELVKLVHLEFFDIKATHSFYLNLLHLIAGVGIAYSLALLYVLTYGTELFLVGLNIFVCLVPCILGLIACAATERKVSQPAKS